MKMTDLSTQPDAFKVPDFRKKDSEESPEDQKFSISKDKNKSQKKSKMFMVEVKHLRDDQAPLNIEILDDPPGQWLMNEVTEKLGGIFEKEYFGLRYLDKHKQRQWLDLSKSVQKQLKKVKPKSLSFRVKHYPRKPLEEFRSERTRYLLYLQLRRDLHSGRLVGRNNDMQILAAQILQAEIGDYTELMDYLGENGSLADLQMFANMTPRVEAKIMDIHKSLVGLNPSEVESMFLEKATEFDTYGVEPIYVEDRKGNGFYAGLNHEGVITFRDNRKVHVFAWNKISKISYDKRLFIIQVEWEQRRHILGFKCQTRQAAEALWKWAVDRQGFFTLNRAVEAKESKASAGFFKPRQFYLFTGRCQKELMQLHSSMPNIPQSSVKRSRSLLNIAIKVNNAKRYQSQDALNKRIQPKNQFSSEQDLHNQPNISSSENHLTRHQSLGAKINSTKRYSKDESMPLESKLKLTQEFSSTNISSFNLRPEEIQENIDQPRDKGVLDDSKYTQKQLLESREQSISPQQDSKKLSESQLHNNDNSSSLNRDLIPQKKSESLSETISDSFSPKSLKSRKVPQPTRVLNQVGVLGASGYIQPNYSQDNQTHDLDNPSTSQLNSPNDFNNSPLKSSRSQINILDPTLNPNSTTTLASVSPQISCISPNSLTSPTKSISQQYPVVKNRLNLVQSQNELSTEITFNTPAQATIYQTSKDPYHSNILYSKSSDSLSNQTVILSPEANKKSQNMHEPEEEKFSNHLIIRTSQNIDGLKTEQSNINLRVSEPDQRSRIQISPLSDYDTNQRGDMLKPPQHPSSKIHQSNSSLNATSITNGPINQPLLINYGYSASSKYSAPITSDFNYEHSCDGKWNTRIESLKQFPTFPRFNDANEDEENSNHQNLYNFDYNHEVKLDSNMDRNISEKSYKDNVYTPLSVDVNNAAPTTIRTSKSIDLNDFNTYNDNQRASRDRFHHDFRNHCYENKTVHSSNCSGVQYNEPKQYRVHVKSQESPNLVGISVKISERQQPYNQGSVIFNSASTYNQCREQTNFRDGAFNFKNRRNHSQSPSGFNQEFSGLPPIGQQPQVPHNHDAISKQSIFRYGYRPNFRPIPSPRLRNRIQYFDNS